MAIASIREQLIRDESEVLHAYPDSQGFLTIGIGRMIDARKGGGITKEESTYLFNNDLTRHSNDVMAHLPWVPEKLDWIRRCVLINMCFNMGIAGLLGFKHFLAAVEAGYYAEAAEHMIDSLWAKQVGPRATRLAKQMLTGEWQ